MSEKGVVGWAGNVYKNISALPFRLPFLEEGFMASHLRLGVLCVFGFCCACVSYAQDKGTPAEIMTKAIAALGGPEKVKAFDSAAYDLKGELHVQSVTLPFQAEVTLQGADRQRIALSFSLEGQEQKIVQILNREKGWVNLNGVTVAMDGDKLTNALAEARAAWIAAMLPLENPEYTLAPLGESKVGDQTVASVRVSCKLCRDVELFFDKDSGLLLKSKSSVTDEATDGQVEQETLYADYTENNGLKTATKLTVKRAGQLYLSAERTNYRSLPEIADSIFAEP